MDKKNNKKVENKRDVVVKVDGISKTFRIPHEKHTSLKAAALNIFEKKTYEEFIALKDISFEIKKGEFFGIIGRNGSGKSTLLKILAGIYMPDEGKVDIKGKLSPFLELGVGFNPELTGRENIFLGGAVLGVSKKEIEKNFDKIVAFSELEEFIDMKLKNYSSGMQVRLAFALSIHAHADILLMDEVLAVGDSNFQAKCIDEFNKYRDQGKTVVLVSHDINTIQRYCDRAMLLRSGKIVKIGEADDIGNEYIKLNMSDEERLSKKSEEEKSVETKSTKKIRVTKVKILDTQGAEKKTFKTADDITIQVDFKKDKKQEKVNIGIGIYKDDGSYVLGYNTLMDDYRIRGNSVEMKLNEAPLLKGSYYLNVVCFGDIEERFYDFKDKAQRFRVFPTEKTDKYRGILNIEHTWS